MTAAHVHALVAIALAAAAVRPAAAQSTLRTATSVHAAWISEVLDLDVPRAAAEYAQVARDRSSQAPERWIAAARLFELQRLDVAGLPRVDVEDAPPAVRSVFAATLPPVDAAAVLQRAREEAPAATPPAGEAPRSPVLRPAVAEVERWVQTQSGVSRRDRRIRQRAEMTARQREAVPDLTAATLVLRAEMEGQRPQADDLRARHFRAWRPPPATGSPAETLHRARAHLAAWRQEPRLAEDMRALLSALDTALQQAEAADPAAGVALVQRLPRFAEWLLAERLPERR